MDSLITALVILAIVMFFAPLIIIFQLSDIKRLLKEIGYHMDMNHDELIKTITKENSKQEQEKNTP